MGSRINGLRRENPKGSITPGAVKDTGGDAMEVHGRKPFIRRGIAQAPLILTNNPI
jgi:hypothetical protein